MTEMTRQTVIFQPHAGMGGSACAAPSAAGALALCRAPSRIGDAWRGDRSGLRNGHTINRESVPGGSP